MTLSLSPYLVCVCGQYIRSRGVSSRDASRSSSPFVEVSPAPSRFAVGQALRMSQLTSSGAVVDSVPPTPMSSTASAAAVSVSGPAPLAGSASRPSTAAAPQPSPLAQRSTVIAARARASTGGRAVRPPDRLDVGPAQSADSDAATPRSASKFLTTLGQAEGIVPIDGDFLHEGDDGLSARVASLSHRQSRLKSLIERVGRDDSDVTVQRGVASLPSVSRSYGTPARAANEPLDSSSRGLAMRWAASRQKRRSQGDDAASAAGDADTPGSTSAARRSPGTASDDDSRANSIDLSLAILELAEIASMGAGDVGVRDGVDADTDTGTAGGAGAGAGKSTGAGTASGTGAGTVADSGPRIQRAGQSVASSSAHTEARDSVPAHLSVSTTVATAVDRGSGGGVADTKSPPSAFQATGERGGRGRSESTTSGVTSSRSVKRSMSPEALRRLATPKRVNVVQEPDPNDVIGQ